MLNFNNIANPGESVAEGRDDTGGAFILPQQVPDAFNIVQRGLDKTAAINAQEQAAHEKALADNTAAALSYQDAWEYDQPAIQKSANDYRKALIQGEIQYRNSKKETDNPELMYTAAGQKLAAMKADILDQVNTSKQQRFYHDEALKKLVANPSAYDNDLENYRKMSLADRRKYDVNKLVTERFNPDTEAGKYRKDVLPKNSTWVKNGLPVGDQQPLVQLNQYDDPQIQGLATSYLQHPGFNNYAAKVIAQQDPDGKLGLTPQQVAMSMAQQRGTFKGEDKFVNALSWQQKEAIDQADKLARDKAKLDAKGDGASPLSLPQLPAMTNYQGIVKDKQGKFLRNDGDPYDVTTAPVNFQYKNYNIPDAGEITGSKKGPNTIQGFRKLKDGTWEMNDTHSLSATQRGPQVDVDGKPILGADGKQLQFGKVSPTGWRKVNTWNDLVLPSLDAVSPKSREATKQKAEQVLYDMGLDENSMTPADLATFQAKMNGTAIPVQAAPKQTTPIQIKWHK